MLWLAIFTYVLCILALCAWMFSGSSNHMYGFDKKDDFSDMSGAEAAKAAADIYSVVEKGTELKARNKELKRLKDESELMRKARENYYDTQYKRMQQGMESQNQEARSAPEQE